MADFATGFRLHLPDGTVLDGAELPSGRVVLDHPEEGMRLVAASVRHATEQFPGARVERPHCEDR